MNSKERFDLLYTRTLQAWY